MTDRSQHLLREALALSADERADVAAELLASLDEEQSFADRQEVAMAWASEIEDRARHVLAAGSAGESWASVRARVAGRLVER